MEQYDYISAIIEDIKDYINDNYTSVEVLEKLEERSKWQDKLYDDLWTVDSVTGNGSGSYTFNAWKAEEYIAHNLDLLAEAFREFGNSTDFLEKGAEACDVTIRCYLLGQAIDQALDELEEELGA